MHEIDEGKENEALPKGEKSLLYKIAHTEIFGGPTGVGPLLGMSCLFIVAFFLSGVLTIFSYGFVLLPTLGVGAALIMVPSRYVRAFGFGLFIPPALGALALVIVLALSQ